MAQQQIYIGKTQVHVIEETAQDAHEAPAGTGANIFAASNVGVSFDSSNHEQNVIRADFLPMDDVPGIVSGSITFEVPIAGSGAAGTAPDFGEAVKGCGCREIVVVSTSVEYVPSSIFTGATDLPGPSYSCSVLRNGVRHAIKGGFGNVAVAGDIEGIGMLRFTYTGAYVAFADDALEGPTYQATVPPAFRGSAAEINFGSAYPGVGETFGLTKFDFDLGNNLGVGRDFNETGGVYGARILGRNPSGSFNAEQTLAAQFNPFADWRAGTPGTFSTGVIGGTAGNKYQIDVPRMQLRTPEVSDDNGIARVSCPFSARALPTDAEGTGVLFSLIFT